MLKLNIRDQSFVVDGYTRGPVGQIVFNSMLLSGTYASLQDTMSALMHSNHMQKLILHIDVTGACAYQCSMTCFEPIYETIEDINSGQLLHHCDFKVSFGNQALACESIEIELNPLRKECYVGTLKGNVWFLHHDQDIQSLTPPWNLILEYYDRAASQWHRVFTGWELWAGNDINSHSANICDNIKGAQFITPLTAILV